MLISWKTKKLTPQNRFYGRGKHKSFSVGYLNWNRIPLALRTYAIKG